jgi:hypothetical protein
LRLPAMSYDTPASCSSILSRVRGSVTNNNRFWIGWLDLLLLSCIITRIYPVILECWFHTSLPPPSWRYSHFIVMRGIAGSLRRREHSEW